MAWHGTKKDDGGMGSDVNFHDGTCRNTAGHDGMCCVTKRGMTGLDGGVGVTWHDGNSLRDDGGKA